MHTERETLATIELPTDLADSIQRTTDRDEPPTTLAEGLDAFERVMESAGVTISVADMYQPEPTRHAVDLGDRVEHVPCVLDALIAAHLVERPVVKIRSEPPTSGDPVRIEVTDDDVDVRPSTAVFSFGLAESDVRDPDPEAIDAMESVSLDSCAYINAFPDEAAYDQWATAVSEAVVMGLDADAMVAIASRVTNGWVFVGES